MILKQNWTKLFLDFVVLVFLGSYFFIGYVQSPAPNNAIVEPEVLGVVTNEQVKPQVLEGGLVFENKIFGFSVQAKPIEGYEIGSGENTLLLHASIHGDEVGTTDLLNALVEEIKNHPEIVATTTKLIIVPIANPDGYYDRTDKLNANLVNLNLNFETTGWQQYGPEGTYAGPTPFSEIESQILKEIVEIYKPDAMIAFHSEGALVSPESSKDSMALAKWYAKQTGYTYYDFWDYPGTATKWFEEVYNKPAITVELTKQLPSDWEINKKALLELISANSPLYQK